MMNKGREEFRPSGEPAPFEQGILQVLPHGPGKRPDILEISLLACQKIKSRFILHKRDQERGLANPAPSRDDKKSGRFGAVLVFQEPELGRAVNQFWLRHK